MKRLKYNIFYLRLLFLFVYFLTKYTTINET